MFVRIKLRDSGKTAVQIVEGIRSGNTVNQKVFRHVGLGTNPKEIDALRQLAESIIIDHKNAKKPVLPIFEAKDFHTPIKRKSNDLNDTVSMSKLREEKKVIDGIHDIFGKMYDDLGFSHVIRNTRKNDNWNAILKACVMARIAAPMSKRATSFMLDRDYDIDIPLDRIYDMMDHLIKREKSIKQKIARNTLGLFKAKVDILFFDVTTLYFESILQDEIRDFGFSKDCKFKEVQIVLALVATTDGLPITYKLFPGNTYEGHTLIEIIKELKNDYQIENVLLVADRAMFNKNNLDAMEDLGINYIVAAKLKTLSKDFKKEILSDLGYKGCVVADEFHWLNEFIYQNRRLIVSYSSNRARKDASDRNRLIERLLKKVKGGKIGLKDLIPNYGTKKYLKLIGGEAFVNEDKISDDAQWDGIHGVITNVKNKNPEDILSRYRELWQIEESFRINKHNLKMRPIFHWNSNRIKSHILLCFMAYSVLRYVENSLKYSRQPPSIETIRNELRHVQSTIVIHLPDKKRYVIPSPLTTIQKNIYQHFGVKRSFVPYAID